MISIDFLNRQNAGRWSSTKRNAKSCILVVGTQDIVITREAPAGVILEEVNEEKDLGIIISETLFSSFI